MKLHHVGLAVKDVEQAARQYAEILGIGPSSPVIEDGIQHVRVAFATVSADVHVEFIQPTTPDSPVAKLVARGGGIYHLCYVVADMDAALRQARSGGAILISGPVAASAFDGRDIAFLMMPDRSIIEFVEDQQ
jgi:methylmalonyl-CoA/ethylmalonyl-CoA epimerase